MVTPPEELRAVRGAWVKRQCTIRICVMVLFLIITLIAIITMFVLRGQFWGASSYVLSQKPPVPAGVAADGGSEHGHGLSCIGASCTGGAAAW